MDDQAGGWPSHFNVITLYQKQHKHFTLLHDVNTKYRKDKFLKFTIKILSTDTFKQRCQSRRFLMFVVSDLQTLVTFERQATLPNANANIAL